MKCNICGNIVADNTVFCPYCGTAIKKEQINEENINNVETVISNENVQVNNNQGINENNVQSNNINESNNITEVEQINVNDTIAQNNVENLQPVFQNNNVNLQQNPQTSQNNANNFVNNNVNNMYNVQDYQSVQTQSGYSYNTTNNYNNGQIINNNQNVDKTNVLLAILSFFIPIVGIILFFTMKKSSPKTSKACGIVALVAILLSSISLVFGLITIKNIINTSNDYDISEDIEYSYEYLWETYEVKFNSDTIKLPCSYEEFVNITNFNIKTDMENRTLNNNYYDIINIYSNDKLAGMINLYNNTGSSLLYKETNVSRISQTKYNVEVNNVEKFVFPGELSVGMEYTKDDIINLLGEPAKITDSEYNNIKTYNLKYTTNDIYTTSGYYEITIVDNEINELALDNRK